MPGIIHFDRLSRHRYAVSRRSFMLGAAGLSGAMAHRRLAVGGPGTATPDGGMGPQTGAARERLGRLLQLVPEERLTSRRPDTWMFTWSDLETQLAALGEPDLSADPSLAQPVLSPLLQIDQLSRYVDPSMVEETYGFSPLDVHQTLTTETPPNQVTYYAGGMDIDRLPAAWETAGYQHKQGAAGEYWTIGEQGEAMLDTPLGQISQGLLNNIAILDDDMVVFAPRLDLLQAIQSLATKGGASAMDIEAVATLLAAMPEEAVSAAALAGSAMEISTTVPENPGAELTRTVSDLLAESDDAVGPMPVIEMALFGVTAGAVARRVTEAATPAPMRGNPDAFIFVDLLMASPDDAARAERVVDWRIEHMTSPMTGMVYRDLLVPEAPQGVEGAGDVAAFAFTSPTDFGVWVQMIGGRDLLPFVYLAGE